MTCDSDNENTSISKSNTQFFHYRLRNNDLLLGVLFPYVGLANKAYIYGPVFLSCSLTVLLTVFKSYRTALLSEKEGVWGGGGGGGKAKWDR